jgi:large subunit ribosomal protein L10
MIREKKEEIISELAGNLSKCAVAIATDYRGITAKEMVQLRRLLHMQGVDFLVIKNTLAHLAAEKAGIKGMDQFFSGPLAIALSYDDPVKAAKIIIEHIKAANSILKVKGGVMGEKVLGTAEVISLATIPPKEVLIAQLMGRLKTPIYSLHFVLSSPLRGLVGVLQARAKQLEGG